MSVEIDLKQTYDIFAEHYRACCMTSDEIKFVLSAILTEKQKKTILYAAKSGWIKQMNLLDQQLAKEGEQ
jgi:hypothetical protein